MKCRRLLRGGDATAAREMRTPEAAEHRLNRDRLAFGRRADLQPVADIDTNMRNPGVRIGVCNRWAKNAAIGIDRGTADGVRDDARLAAPNTYGSFWDAANRGNRLVDARRTVVIANGASRQRRRGRNGSARCSARNSGTVTIRTARTSSQSPLPKTLTSAEDSLTSARS